MELCHASAFLAGIQAFLRFILDASVAGMTQFEECSCRKWGSYFFFPLFWRDSFSFEV